MIEAQARPDPEAVDTITQVGPDFCLPGEGIRPARVASEGVGVQVRRDVAGAAWVAVVAPCPADIVGLLEDEEAAEPSALEADRRTKPAEAGADDRHIGVRPFAHPRSLLPRRRTLPAVTTVLSPRQIRKGRRPWRRPLARRGRACSQARPETSELVPGRWGRSGARAGQSGSSHRLTNNPIQHVLTRAAHAQPPRARQS